VYHAHLTPYLHAQVEAQLVTASEEADELQSTQEQLGGEIADHVQSIKALFLRAEDARVVGSRCVMI
jgi:1,6-anhydro-N-acetylmuramate kinase